MKKLAGDIGMCEKIDLSRFSIFNLNLSEINNVTLLICWILVNCSPLFFGDSFDENSYILDHREYWKIVENSFLTNMFVPFSIEHANMNFNRGEQQGQSSITRSIKAC